MGRRRRIGRRIRRKRMRRRWIRRRRRRRRIRKTGGRTMTRGANTAKERTQFNFMDRAEDDSFKHSHSTHAT